MKGRRLCVGDIHGGYKALKQVLRRCKYSSLKDQLIFLGDYVDGWSESAEVVDYLIKIKALAKHKPIFIRGNHDIWITDWLNSGYRNMVWLQNGGESTIKSYTKEGHVLNQEHKDFFNSLLNWYVDEDNNLFVHAGWDYLYPDFVTGATVPFGMGGGIGAMACHWNRTLVDAAINMRKSWDAKFDKLKEFNQIFVGHTTTEAWDIKPHLPEYKNKKQPKNGKIVVPMNAFNLWNVDTGGGWGGRLTAMDIDSHQFWQSDNVKDLYSEEKGRT